MLGSVCGGVAIRQHVGSMLPHTGAVLQARLREEMGTKQGNGSRRGDYVV